jgi:aminoglycoside phosphotransferase (APT) family kinase protein
VFPTIGVAHPLAPELEVLRARVEGDPVLGGRAPAAVVIRPRLRVRAEPDGRCALDRFYWSAQWREPGPPPRFRARTLFYEPRRGDPFVRDFPDDPGLPAAAAPASALHDAATEVLRYIPLTRITFLAGDVVGKMKRPSSAARSYERLAEAAGAARRQGASFAVAEPLGIDAEHGAFYQRRLAGRSLTELLGDLGAEGLLARVGDAHRQLHELDVPGAPVQRADELLGVLRADVAWIAWNVPELAGALQRIERWVQPRLATEPREHAFCHLDMDPDHVLCAPDGALALLDLDDATMADPCADVATMLTVLSHRAPSATSDDGTGGPLGAAYLDGYRRRARRAPDERRLAAHRVRAELVILASRLQKGLLDAAQTTAAVDGVERLCAG